MRGPNGFDQIASRGACLHPHAAYCPGASITTLRLGALSFRALLFGGALISRRAPSSRRGGTPIRLATDRLPCPSHGFAGFAPFHVPHFAGGGRNPRHLS